MTGKLTKTLLIVAGSVFLVVAIVGVFVPLLPTTPFLLLAAACYARGSQRFYDWLLNNRWFGRYIRDYRDGRGIPWRVKALTLLLLWATIGCSAAFAVDSLPVRVVLAVIAVGVTAHIFLVPNAASPERRPTETADRQ